jgi:hypothetical protein
VQPWLQVGAARNCREEFLSLMAPPPLPLRVTSPLLLESSFEPPSGSDSPTLETKPQGKLQIARVAGIA